MGDASRLRHVLETTPPADLLPDRQQARTLTTGASATFVDALVLGDDTGDGIPIIGLLRSGDRLLVAPGRVHDDRFERDATVASALIAGRSGAFNVYLPHGSMPAGPAIGIDVDQSNDSIILGDVLCKWQLVAQVSPAPARLQALAGRGITPEVRGVLSWSTPSGDALTLLTAVDYLPASTDGWQWAVELVRGHALGRGEEDALAPFAAVGSLVGRMHVAFAGSDTSTWDAARLSALEHESQDRLRQAIDLIDGAEGERLRAREARLAARLAALRAIDSTPTMPIHGDLHIGQVLRSQSPGGFGYSIVDFDGSPLLDAQKRSEPQPAAVDVAGMLASIDHVARVVNHRTPGLDPRPAIEWIPLAQEAFLRMYSAALAGAGMEHLLDHRLVPPLLVDQECREFVYAALHLPHWRYVPDAVITDMFAEEE